ncbi:RsbR, positive regulator of sigma-B [Enhygromyxa salina]|uniref:RsbR, positive regulator of sigma-B n=1 Tax=Enhygromyxa salina TaxID=215803 RepID=A0A0C2A590_9BACT|nr:RsbR, positive regulator of sigma-B [Enhygromyxa salina]
MLEGEDPRIETIRDNLLEALLESGHGVATPPDPTQGDPIAELLAVSQQIRDTARAERALRVAAEQRLEELLEVVVALVSFDYARKATISDSNDVFDGMAAGLNMLGEELSSSTVSRDYVTNIIESMTDAVIVADPEGIIATANGATSTLVGRPSEDLLGQPLTEALPGVAVESLLDASGGRELELVLSRPDKSGKSGDTNEVVTASLSASVMRHRGKLVGLVCVVRDTTESRRLDEERWRLREAVQRQAILVEELSTPLIPITDQILVMPLVGPVDAHRATQMTEVLLQGIVARHAKVAILDITGVRSIDLEAVVGITRATRAAGLVGAEVLLTGIRPDVVRSLIEIGTDVDSFVSFSTLQSGIVHAMSRVARRPQR